MFKRIWSFIMSAVIFICSLLGIRIGGTGNGEEMITYNKTHTVVTISLDENPSTGYGWEYKPSADGVVQLTADDYRSDAPVGVVGAGGIRSLSFAGIAEGTVRLTFDYLRPWEGAPIRTVVIEVRVAADLHVEASLVNDVTYTK